MIIGSMHTSAKLRKQLPDVGHLGVFFAMKVQMTVLSVYPHGRCYLALVENVAWLNRWSYVTVTEMECNIPFPCLNLLFTTHA